MRLVPALLALSLAANVFLGGYLFGQAFGPPGPHHRGLRGSEVAFEGRVLSPAGREIVRAAFRERREDLLAHGRESHAARAAVAEALGAAPFDRARLEAALALHQAKEAERHRGVAAALIDAAEQLSPEDRKALAAEHFRPRHGRRGTVKRLIGETPRGPEGPPPE